MLGYGGGLVLGGEGKLSEEEESSGWAEAVGGGSEAAPEAAPDSDTEAQRARAGRAGWGWAEEQTAAAGSEAEEEGYGSEAAAG